MSLFAFPCPACGESCQWPERFCPGCGAAVRHVNTGGLQPPSPVVQSAGRPPAPWRRRLARAVLVAAAALAAVAVVAAIA